MTQHFTTHRLGALGTFRNGVNFTKDQKGGDGEDSFAIINVKDIFTSGRHIDFATLDRVSLPDIRNRERYTVRRGDLYFVRSSVKRDGIGLVSLSTRDDDLALHCGFVIRFRIESTAVDRLFLVYQLRSGQYRDTLKNLSGGSAITNISQDSLASLEVSLPPLLTQRKIAGVLSAYDDLIENNTRRIAILEEMAQAIYREWFVNFRFPGHEKVKVVDSPLGKIPEGWKLVKLKDVCDSVKYGYTASANKDVEVGPRFLRITDIVPSTIDWENVPYCKVDADDGAKYALREGDIVIARTGATTGYAKRLHKRHPKSVFASYLVRIVPNDAVGKHYIGLIVESDDYKAFIKRNLGGAAQPQANAQVLTSLDVLVPSKDVITAFDCQVEPLADQKEILQVKNRNLRKTRDLLLPKLISGQLDLEELEIETAEPLVEAIA